MRQMLVFMVVATIAGCSTSPADGPHCYLGFQYEPRGENHPETRCQDDYVRCVDARDREILRLLQGNLRQVIHESCPNGLAPILACEDGKRARECQSALEGFAALSLEKTQFSRGVVVPEPIPDIDYRIGPCRPSQK